MGSPDRVLPALLLLHPGPPRHRCLDPQLPILLLRRVLKVRPLETGLLWLILPQHQDPSRRAQ
jgi:hypothetical protein